MMSWHFKSLLGTSGDDVVEMIIWLLTSSNHGARHSYLSISFSQHEKQTTSALAYGIIVTMY